MVDLRRLGQIFAAMAAIIIFALSTSVARADQKTVELIAARFWYDFDHGDLAQLYRSLSEDFRGTFSEQQFVQHVGMSRIHSGGPAQTRTLVGSQAMVDPPGAPKGAYFYTRFKGNYPNGAVFHDVYLQKTGDVWRVWSFNVLAAPN